MNPKIGTLVIAACSLTAISGSAWAAGGQDSERDNFTLSSTTFSNGETMPLTTLSDIESNGVNVCSVNGMPGGNESPELSWENAPAGTRSFVVIAFDVTAGFVHWGMYNIAPNISELPQNAGVTGSKYGQQVVNNFGGSGSSAHMSYDGPCPPANYPPNVHHYVFTVYALDIQLKLPSSPNFPATAVTLFNALVEAGKSNHVLKTASITGLYSSTPG